MSFVNRIRLPLYLSKPQFPVTKDVYTKSNGEQKTLSSSIKKTYALMTDYMPETWHERLHAALLHDTVNIEGDKYAGGVKLEKMDEIDWVNFLDYPLARVNGVVSVDPFFAVNSNCQSCEEFTQVVAEDDEAGDVDEGQTYTVDVAENDSIFCQPATFEIVSYDSDYLENVSIDADGVVSFDVKENVVAVNGLSAIKYRVTCANDQYDEANVIINVLGTLEGCLAPTGLSYTTDEESPTTATFNWLAPSPAPADGYDWALFTADNLVTPIYSGTVVGLTVNVILPTHGAQYVFMVRGKCDDDVFSNWIQVSLTAPVPDSQNCGLYAVYFDDGTGIATHTTIVTYLDCNSQYQDQLIYNQNSAMLCALQSSVGVPVSIIGATSVYYAAGC